MKSVSMNTFMICLFVWFACNTGPEPINFGSDQCDHCRMKIMEKNFGAEIVTGKGKILKFDAAECMINYLKANSDAERGGKLYVINYNEPEKLIDATGAGYLVSPGIRSPMGENISAYLNIGEAEKKQKQSGGDVYGWDGIRDHLKK